MGYLIDLEGKLRLVDTSLAIYVKYATTPPPSDETLPPLREFLIGSSGDALVQSVQQLLLLVLDGLDRGLPVG
jgi:hypothetical protein